MSKLLILLTRGLSLSPPMCHHDRPWSDNQCPCHYLSNIWNILHGCRCISNDIQMLYKYRVSQENDI